MKIKMVKKKKIKHSKNWFRQRLNQTIYRDPIKGKCKCAMCQSNNVIIHNGSKHGDKYLHADYLFDCQNEEGIIYRDKL